LAQGVVLVQMKDHDLKVNWYPGDTSISCSEAVIRVALEKIKVESSDALKISSALGGGVGGFGEICGAVTGAILAIGLRYGRDNETQPKDEVRNITRELLQEFRDEFGYLRCNDLIIGLDKEGKRKKCHEIAEFVGDKALKLL